MTGHPEATPGAARRLAVAVAVVAAVVHRRPADQVVGRHPPDPGLDPRDRHPRPPAVPQHRRLVQPVPGEGLRAGAGGGGPGGRASGHGVAGPHRRAGPPSSASSWAGRWATWPTGSSATTTVRWSTSWPCTSGPPSTWPTPPSWWGASCSWSRWCGGRGRRDRAGRHRARLARRCPGGQGGVTGGRPVALDGQRLVERGRVRIDGARGAEPEHRPAGGPAASRSTRTPTRARRRRPADPGVDFGGGLRGPRPHRGGQAGRTGRPPRCGTSQRHPGPRTAGPLSRARGARARGRARTPTAPGSSTGWTVAPRG